MTNSDTYSMRWRNSSGYEMIAIETPSLRSYIVPYTSLSSIIFHLNYYFSCYFSRSQYHYNKVPNFTFLLCILRIYQLNLTEIFFTCAGTNLQIKNKIKKHERFSKRVHTTQHEASKQEKKTQTLPSLECTSCVSTMLFCFPHSLLSSIICLVDEPKL